MSQYVGGALLAAMIALRLLARGIHVHDQSDQADAAAAQRRAEQQ
jgi:hypothetical protein